MDENTRNTLLKIIDSADTVHDLKWKLKKYIKNDDLSFLGVKKK